MFLYVVSVCEVRARGWFSVVCNLTEANQSDSTVLTVDLRVVRRCVLAWFVS